MRGISGGSTNVINSGTLNSVITGGISNTITGSISFASGSNCAITHNNAFVWGGSGGAAASKGNNTFFADAPGGVWFTGVRGNTTTNVDAIAVLIDSAGELGTVSSSIRYKEEVKDMDNKSEKIHDLRPVTFKYKDSDSDKLQYGLIAEEVEEVYPDLVVKNGDGEVETVQYHKLPSLLLNEVKKNRSEINDLKTIIADLQTRLEALE